jgi:histidinol-phosphate aminotransferase
MELLFRPNIEAIRPYEPGKPVEEVQRELGLRSVIKLASNENPLGPPKSVERAIRQAAHLVSLYPDGAQYRLKEALARRLGVSRGSLIFGNGSNEIVELILRGFAREGDRVVTSQLSFLVYRLIAQAIGAEVVEVPMKNFRYDLTELAREVNERTSVIFVANPNNPTGTYANRSEVLEFLDLVPNHVLVCFDEAYFEFVEAKDFPSTLDYLQRGNVIVLRTFSKCFGMAGLRLGYGVASERIIEYLNKVRQPFNVNLIAQAAGLAALEDRDYLRRTQELVWEGKRFLAEEFKKLGLECVPSEANFILVNIKRDAEQVFQKLLKRGIVIRSMKAYGLGHFIRVSVGTRRQNRKFIKELKKVLKQQRS